MRRREKMSDWARIERSKELRKWVVQVIMPCITFGGYIWMTNEDIRNYVALRVELAKAKVQEKYNQIFHKEKEDGGENH